MKIPLKRNYSFIFPLLASLSNIPRLIEKNEFIFLGVLLAILIISIVIGAFMRFYKIENKQFYLEIFFIKTGKIDIQTIKSIDLGKGNWFYSDYLTIKHGKFDTSYVKPKNNKELIDAFLSINPNVKVNL